MLEYADAMVHQAQDRRRARWTKVGIALAVLAMVLSLPFAHDPMLNSWRLSRMASRVSGLSHPSGTSHVATHQRVGIQVGNGNHCDYFVAEVRTFDMPREALQAHYVKQTFANPVSRQQDGVEVVFLADDLNASALPDEFASLSAWGVPQNVPLTKLYAVVVFYSYEANADIRCH